MIESSNDSQISSGSGNILHNLMWVSSKKLTTIVKYLHHIEHKSDGIWLLFFYWKLQQKLIIMNLTTCQILDFVHKKYLQITFLNTMLAFRMLNSIFNDVVFHSISKNLCKLLNWIEVQNAIYSSFPNKSLEKCDKNDLFERKHSEVSF